MVCTCLNSARKGKVIMKKQTKKEIYASYGIQYENGYIYSELLGMWIKPLLIDGNDKLGKTVWTWSMLPTNQIFTINIGTESMPIIITIKGTCPCHCQGCYATKGNFARYESTRISLARKTYLAYYDLDFVKRAIIAQIKADNIKYLRIHASGDFFSIEYIGMWIDIAIACNTTIMWTYTKYAEAENAFDNVDNVNVVKSVIAGHGLNFGHCDYIVDVYNDLKAQGKSVYICRCGIDKEQRCNNCKGCSVNEYVLFIEHSTGYKAEKDLFYSTVKAIIESQKKPE